MRSSLERVDIAVDRENAVAYLEQIVELDRACFPDDPWDSEIWTGLFNNLQLQLFVTLQRNDPIAFLAISLMPPEAELLRIGVKEAYRRQAIGTRLIEQLVSELKVIEVTTLFLEVRQDNLPACEFYQARGFVRMGERKNYYRSPPGHAMLLKRAIV
jgi:[ribosomal protein S18]-alanine N-acetyltransferase